MLIDQSLASFGRYFLLSTMAVAERRSFLCSGFGNGRPRTEQLCGSAYASHTCVLTV